MPTVEDERRGDVVAVRDVEQPRPEVVVLALREGRVVPELVPLEDGPVDDHGRMEERRREERRPTNRPGADGHAVHPPERSVGVEVDRPGPDDRRRGQGAYPPDDPLEPARGARRRPRPFARRTSPERRRGRRSARRRDPAASRSGAPGASGPRPQRARRRCRRRSRRRPRPARDRRPSVGGRSRRLPRPSSRHRERRGRRTRAGWPRPAEGSLRRWREPPQTSASTLSSRRSTAPPSSRRSSTPWTGRPTGAFASSSSTRTPTTAWQSSSPLTPRSTCCTSARHAASRARATRRWRRSPATPSPSRTTTAATLRIFSSGSRGGLPRTRSSAASPAARSPPTAQATRPGRPSRPCSTRRTCGTA